MLKFLFFSWLFSGFLFLSGSVASAEAASVGVVVSAYGETWALTGKIKRTLKKGDLLQSYQTIVTGKNGRVRMLMADKSKVYLNPRSRLKLQLYQVTQGKLISGTFHMFWGKIRFIVNKLRPTNSEFSVHTQTAVLGVRGTDFEVKTTILTGVDPLDPDLTLKKMPPSKVTIKLAEGSLELATLNGGSTTMNEGFQATINPNGVITTAPLSEGEAGNSESNDKSQTPKSDSMQRQQTANQLSNTVGAGTSAVQGSTITTPYNYKFGGR